MENTNKAIAGIFGVEYRYKGKGAFKSAYMDFRTMVDVPCKECGGSGETQGHIPPIELSDGQMISDKVKCPCQGKPRRISLLQKYAEEQGMWEAFIQDINPISPVLRSHGGGRYILSPDEILEFARMITDLNTLLPKFIEFKEG